MRVAGMSATATRARRCRARAHSLRLCPPAQYMPSGLPPVRTCGLRSPASRRVAPRIPVQPFSNHGILAACPWPVVRDSLPPIISCTDWQRLDENVPYRARRLNI